METDFHDAEPVRRFVQNFIFIWEDRYTRLRNASRARDRSAAIEVLLGIKTSSLMLGAVQLAELAGDLEARLRQGGSGRITPARLLALAECGNSTVQRLSEDYLRIRAAN